MRSDGVTMSVTVFVAKVGLVTKAAAGKLIVFAQDRYDLTKKLLDRMKEADEKKQKEGAR